MTPPAWTDVAADLAAALKEARRASEKHALGRGLDGLARENNELAVGKHLHDAYSAAEKALERMVELIDGNLPGGSTYHRDLIRRAALDLPGGRRAMISPETAEELRRLLGFRHVFRHVYGAFRYDLAAPNVAVAETAVPRLAEELTAFAAALGLAPRA